MERVRIVSTGGTIASTTGESGDTPSKSGDDLVDAVPDLESYAEIELEDLCQVSGFHVTFERAGEMVDAVERAAADGVDGVVVTHGTDTMAESAYYCDLALEFDDENPLPVVFTGAQRSFDRLGTDGPTNLLTAVRTAAHERFRAAGGSHVAFNESVHAARRVEKTHTSKLETFQSPDGGPVAELGPDGFRFFREPGSETVSMPGARIDPEVQVRIVSSAMGVEGRQVERALADGVDGIVVAGTGLGNTTVELAGALEDAIDAGTPVVLTSRCHAGATAGRYGGPGGARTLLEAGAISGGDRPSWKARILLALALSRGDDEERIQALFESENSGA